MATPGPTILLTSDTGAQFSPMLEGGVCSLPDETEAEGGGNFELVENTLLSVKTEEAPAPSSPLSSSSSPESNDAATPHPPHPPHYYPQSSTVAPTGHERHTLPPRSSSEMDTPPHIHASGLSAQLDGGVLAATTLTDTTPTPGPPPAPPEYHDPPSSAESEGLTGTVIAARSTTTLAAINRSAHASGIDLRANALATPLIPVTTEYEDGLIPVEVVGSITNAATTSPTTTDATESLRTGTRPQSVTSQQRAAPASDSDLASPTSAVGPWSSALPSPGITGEGRPAAPVAPVTPAATLPGEDVMFEGNAKIGEGKEEGSLYIGRNQTSRDFRIQWQTSGGRETIWMRSATSQLMPLYAKDHSSLLQIYLRDNNGARTVPFEFPTADQLFKAQTAVTGERVILDVSSARWIRVNKPSGGSAAQTFIGVRIQIWHENRKATSLSTLPRRMSSDSRVSTASSSMEGLSGPRREYMVPLQSRLVVFLGQQGGYLTLPITDDVEMEDKGDTAVRLKARRYGGLRRRRSQPGIRARLVPPSDDSGLPFDNGSNLSSNNPNNGNSNNHEGTNNKNSVGGGSGSGVGTSYSNSDCGGILSTDGNEKYECYKSLDMEFETQPTKKEFVDVWNEVVEFRRKQRAKIDKIHEEMGRETFTGKQAIRTWF